MTLPFRDLRLPRAAGFWLAVLTLLLILRLPSLGQPAGGDQGLYAYAGTRILAGDVMYRDMWDQKPPAIAAVYAVLSRFWPGESVVPGADLVAAALVSALLVVLGCRRFTANVGFGAAAAFLLLGDPYLQRLGGIYVRGQCEPFIALAVTASLVMLSFPHRRRHHLVAAGVALGGAFWLKYSAAYALPVVVATWVWRDSKDQTCRAVVSDLLWVGLGFGAVAAAVLGYFAAHGALADLRLATIDYNLRYSNETYQGPVSMLAYLGTFPFRRAQIDMLWFVGGIGILLLGRRWRQDRSWLVVAAWLVAAVLSIAINGSRGLPNYFVQANPALALAAGAGLASLGTSRAWLRVTVAVLLAAGLWRVGTDTPVWGLRLASVPGLIANVNYDLGHVRGTVDRETYLRRFRGQKHDALEIDRLARHLRDTTSPADRVFVFGFSGGSVCWKSERASASRFFWSMPIINGFASERAGYGVDGLLAELTRHLPVVVVLQKEEWRSRDFFLADARLRTWLEAGYRPERETSMFSVWRRKPER